MKLEDFKEVFHWDGSWRDIYVSNTTLDDWDALFDLLRHFPCKLGLPVDVNQPPLPAKAIEIFSKDELSPSLSIDLGGVVIVAHFFEVTEMEFDIDPREISSQERLDWFIEFLVALGEKLQKDIRVTEENHPDEIWIRYTADTGKVSFELPDWALKERARSNS